MLEEHSGSREVRLRPEFAGTYPELTPGKWIPAAEWAAAIVSRAQEARTLSLHRRTFDSRHFDFRGGPAPRKVGRRHLRTRMEDR
jgi:hypothetical protein